MLNLSILLEDTAREHPDRDALVFGDLRVPYSLLNTFANQVANLLVQRGIRPGDRVAISCPNLPYFPFVYYGILKAGAVVVPLNVLLQSREIAYHLEDSDAKALFCFEGTPELPMGERGWEGFQRTEATEHFFVLPATPLATESSIEGAETIWAALGGLPGEFESVQTRPDDTAVILYTSGTTGQPKGAELTHMNMLLNAIVSDEMFERSPHDKTLAVLPLFHSFGQTAVMNMAFRRGATLLLLPRFEAVPALELMAKEGATLFAGVPTMYWGMVSAIKAEGAPVPESLKVLVSGGASLPMELLKDVEAVFGVKVLEGYGLSETSPVASFNRPDRPTKQGSIGVPIWGVEMRLIDGDWNTVPDGELGEIAIRGHNVMKGYLGRPEATAEVMNNGWFRTGDLGRKDEDGYYYIVDRVKDMIIRGGFNVYPREIEEVLMTHPEVSLAAVVGVPHETHGEEIKAYVIRQPDAKLTEDELIAWCKEQFAAYKYPRVIEFRDQFPMTASGKILKREL
ncbi:long-chain-fatty-acid--CoA ligase [Bailinhaonella thermotolerans]|uniref:Long-chain fatty acid--CoA ligase n=1 Tax=Bailinhaonella thermotolerans TaxID=1070861 RepID=A0A3A4AZ99_9ACTN|nr:long-chain fatty acid--CoA ligase [Bailinhaonella thermotolerans]RJL34453.1 long-chain fatty acid--CoA ligase [Bailinhaonella thermotolerans]